MTVPTLDSHTAIALLREIVAERGRDYVYLPPKDKFEPDDDYPYSPSCVYVSGDAPSCLIGRVMVRAGATIGGLRILDEVPGGISASVLYKYPTVGIRVTERASAVLGAAQRVQDGGRTWGEALDRAEYLYTANDAYLGDLANDQ